MRVYQHHENARPTAHPTQAAKREFFKQYQAKRKTANGAKLVSGSWCTQQDSNLWPFDS